MLRIEMLDTVKRNSSIALHGKNIGICALQQLIYPSYSAISKSCRMCYFNVPKGWCASHIYDGVR